MARFLRAALAQVNTTVGDIGKNLEIVISRIEEADEASADIVTFPELCLCGYPPEDLLLKEGFIRDCREALQELALRAPKRIIAAVGCVHGSVRGGLYNACAVIQGGALRGVYCKIELPNYGVFDEKRYFRAGSDPFIFGINGIPSGINICEDIWLCRAAEAQAGNGAEIIFNISSSPFHIGKRASRFKAVSEKAKSLNIPVCYNNAVGGQDELVFDGGSFVVDGQGGEIASCGQFEESLLVCDIRTGEPGVNPGTAFSLETRRTGTKPEAACAPPAQLSETGEMYGALVLGTRDYARKNGFRKAVIGISGGIDSALTAAVACDALGADNLTGLLMPSRFSSRATLSDSRLLAELLDIRLMEISIEPVFRAIMESLGGEFSCSPPGPAEENLQARLRGNILMAFSNKFGWLVLTTGNKSEISCGYCTLYGDMAGGFSVLKDVYKTSVYKLAEFRNSTGPAVPPAIIEKAPTAELKHGQRDQDALPPYEILDDILRLYIEEDVSPREMEKTGKFDRKTLRRVVSMVDASEFKRRQAPPGIKITPAAFGRDRRMPLTNRYSGFDENFPGLLRGTGRGK